MSSSDVRLVPVPFEEKAVLQRLLELYLHDLSEFDEDIRLNEHGLYGYRYLDHYWTDEDRFAFFVRAREQIAGFALVRRLSGDSYQMAEFFVLRSFRRRGIGEAAARQLFARFPGNWEVPQLERNAPAQAFWRRVIGDYTGGKYTEERDGGDGDVVERFVTP
jgi:predicted acetyltransferase